MSELSADLGQDLLDIAETYKKFHFGVAVYNELLNLENLKTGGLEVVDKDANGCVVKRVVNFFKWRSEIVPKVRSNGS